RRSSNLAQMAEAIPAATRLDSGKKTRLMNCEGVEESAPAGATKMNAIDGNRMATAFPRPDRRAATRNRHKKNRSTRHPERSASSSFMKTYRATSCRALITSDCIEASENVSRNDPYDDYRCFAAT